MSFKRKGRLNTTEFKDGIVIKTSHQNEQNRPYRLRREATILRELQGRHINVPMLIDYEITDDGRERMILKRIEGKNLYNAQKFVKPWALNSVGGQLRSLEGVFRGYGWLDVDTGEGMFPSWKSFLDYFFRRYGNNLVFSGCLKREDFDFILRELLDLTFSCVGSSIVHRDIKIGNILFGNDGRIWILDWENAILGDSKFDLAQFSANYGRRDLWRSFSDGFGLVDLGREYILYEIIVLVSAIDFCIKFRVPFRQRLQRLERRIASLK